MVIGPTPPGTGVMYEHLGATSLKATSPVSLNPDLVLLLGTRVVPTSITTTPSLTISPFQKFRYSQSSNNDVGLQANLFDVRSAAVANSYCTIARIAFLHHQHGYRFPDNIASSQYHAVLSPLFLYCIFSATQLFLRVLQTESRASPATCVLHLPDENRLHLCDNQLLR